MFVDLDGVFWRWQFPFEYKALNYRVPTARYIQSRRSYVAQATPFVSAELAQVVAELPPGVRDRMRISPRLEETAKLVDPPPYREDLPPVYRTDAAEHWPDQLRAYHQVYDRYNVAPSAGVVLDMAMGSGKSRVVVDIIQNLAPLRDSRRASSTKVLVICPSRVRAVWPYQAIAWAAEPTELGMIVLGGRREQVPLDETSRMSAPPEHWVFEHRSSLKKRAEALNRGFLASSAYPGPTIVVVNYEAVWRKPLSDLMLATPWEAIILDESHRAKAPAGKAAQFLQKLAARARLRIAMTGTFMPHSPLDAFPQARIVDPGAFGTRVSNFRAEFLYIHPRIQDVVTKNPQTGDWFQTPIAREIFEDKIGRLSYRVEMDTSRLPALVHKSEFAELEPSAAKLYKDLEKDLYGEIDQALDEEIRKHPGSSIEELRARVVRSKSAMNLVSKLQQVCSGLVATEDKEWHRVSKAKAKLLEDLLADLPEREPVVVFCRFIDDLAQIREVGEKLGRRVGEVSGRRSDVEGRWLASDGYDLLAVQTQSGAEGVDYTRSRYAFFWSLWGGGAFAQSRARVYRPGQDRTTFLIYLCTASIHASGRPMVDTRLMQNLFNNEAALAAIANSAIERVRGSYESAT